MGATRDELWLDLTTNYPEDVVNVGKITFGEDQRKRKKLDKSSKEKLDSQNIKLTRAACALLNSGGGVIRAEIENENYSFMRHQIGLDIEKSFRDCIQSDLFNDYFDVVQESPHLDIWVKTWSSETFSQPTVISKARLCCLETGLLWRSGTSAVQMKPLEALNFLKAKQASAKKDPGEVAGLMSKRARLSDGIWHSKEGGVHVEEDILKAAARFLKRDSLKFGEFLDFSESTEVELKELTRVGDILEFVRATLPKYISAFANTKGGYLIYGVSDDGKVTGYEENIEPDQLEIEVQEATESLPHFHFCASFKKVTTECKILPVYGENGTRHGYVFAVQVEPFCCVVFVAAPDSWIVKDRQVKKLRVDEWVELMTAQDPDLSHFDDGFQLKLSRSCKAPLTKSVYSAKGVACLKDLQNSLCPGDSTGIGYKPEELCTELFLEYEGLKNVMHKKMEELQLSQGVLMFSRSWAVDVGLQQNSWVACDVFLVARDTFPRLYTITVDKDYSVSPMNPVLEYSRNVSRVLKQKLVNEGGYTRKLSVVSHVIKLGISGEVKIDRSSQVTCPQPYLISSHEDLMQALAIVLLRFRSFLSDQLGCEFFNLLTIKQHEILTKNLHKNKKLFIYGLPGSGKTIVALQIIEKMKNVFCCDSEEILFICENRPLCETVRMKNICKAVTRASFLKGNYPSSVKHIIIDEAQNFQAGSDDWYGEAVKITQADARKPGILWIFLDYLQKTHPFDCGLPPPYAQQPQEWLTLGVRNATNIYDIMKEQMHSILSCPNEPDIPYEQLETLVEEARCGHSLAGVLVQPEVSDENTIAGYVVNHCRKYFQNGYSGKNMAILCSTTTERDKYRPLLESEMSRQLRKQKFEGFSNSQMFEGFSNADDAKGNSIVLDSVRRFSGLERSIVFSIYPLSTQEAIAENLLLCMVSRANLHCHLLYAI